MKRLLGLGVIWGFSFLFIKVAVAGLTPTTVAGGRVALGAVVLLGILRIQGVALPRDRRLWWHFAFVGLVGCAIPFTLLAWGEERITSALTAVLNASTPMFTAVAAAALLRDRLRGGQVLGLLIGAAGVAVAAGLGGEDLASSSLTGSAAAVVAGACYGLAFAYTRRHLMGIPPLVAATGQLVMASVLLAPVAVSTSVGDGFSLSPTRVGAMIALGVLGTGIAYVINYRTIAELGATAASLVTYVVPVVAVVVGIVVLREPFHLRLVVGGLLIIAGIAAVRSGWPKPPGLTGRSGFRRRVDTEVLDAGPSTYATEGEPPGEPVARAAGRRSRLGPKAAVTANGRATNPRILVMIVAVLLLAACGDGDGRAEAGSPANEPPATGLPATGPGATEPAGGPCGAVETEPLDDAYLVHVLPTGVEPTYQTDPPTSGQHQPSPEIVPVQAEPIPRPVQVGLLERGEVLIQHRDLPPEARVALEAIAGDGVIVAPNPELPAPVVTTAWVTKLRCEAVDVAVLRGFVAEHGGQGPAH